MSVDAFSGVDGTVKAGAAGTVDMNISSWSLDLEVDEIDVSNTGDGGFSNVVPGLQKISGTFEFPWDPANPPTGASALCGPKSNPVLELKLKSGVVFTGTALITKLAVKSGVNDAVTAVVSFRNKGQWTLPT